MSDISMPSLFEPEAPLFRVRRLGIGGRSTGLVTIPSGDHGAKEFVPGQAGAGRGAMRGIVRYHQGGHEPDRRPRSVFKP